MIVIIIIITIITIAIISVIIVIPHTDDDYTHRFLPILATTGSPSTVQGRRISFLVL